MEIFKKFINELQKEAAEQLATSVKLDFNEIIKEAEKIIKESKQIGVKTKAYYTDMNYIIKEKKDKEDKLKEPNTLTKEQLLEFPTWLKEYQKKRLQIKNNHNYHQLVQEYKKYALDVHKFQKDILAIIDKKMIIAFFIDGKTYILDDASYESFLKGDTSNEGALNLRIRSSKKILNNLEEQNKIIQSHLKNIDNLKFADSKTMQKYNLLKEAHSVINERYDKTKKQIVYFLNSSPPPKWRTVYVQSKGSITEAYVHFLLNHLKANNLNSVIEEFMNHVLTGVTNLSGSLTGDETFKTLEIQTKSEGSSISSLEPIIKIAENIVNNKTIKDIAGIKNFLLQYKKNEKGNTINKEIENYFDDKIEKEVEKLIKELEVKKS